ncbi:hypothetical protein L6164_034554 [Bauhinia variegata]|uniref:Uncharacterized protein n=1 Tax=Bauhinia variegata TaxID=167791 RepID=A0ACB9KVI8_BAUVA|nr:hypothetical protein L6164_034554 [Bauhinia variegata]
MGRKPNAAKHKEKAPMLENVNASLERVESMPGENREPSSKKVESFEGFSSPQSETQQKSARIRGRSSKKFKNNSITVLRRSQRIKSTVVHTSNQDLEPDVEDLTLSDNENDEPDTQVDKVLPEPEAKPSEQGLEEKIDCLFQRLEALENLIESLQSRLDENIGLNEAASSASISYRGLYFDCQKKIEALTNENRQLTGKLENALGKVEVYEKENRNFLEALEKMKDVIMISNLAKTTEAAVSAQKKRRVEASGN